MTEHECPSCGRGFGTHRGLSVHHTQIHGEQLPNRECAHCGTTFYSDYEKKYCSEDCHREAVSFEGADNPSYDGGKSETECESCGEMFSFYPSEKEGVYCPDCVEDVDWRDPPSMSGPNHPRWSGGTREVDCDVCGRTIERASNNLTGDRVFCSDDCHHQWLSEAFTGEGHPNWEGGDVGNYGPGWNRVRRQALERDGYACVVCGKGRNDIGRNPDVHHVRPVRAFVESDDHDVTDAHSLENVVSLCVECHRRADAGVIPAERLRPLATDDR